MGHDRLPEQIVSYQWHKEPGQDCDCCNHAIYVLQSFHQSVNVMALLNATNGLSIGETSEYISQKPAASCCQCMLDKAITEAAGWNFK